MVGGAPCSVGRRRSWWRTARGGSRENGLDPPSPASLDSGSWFFEVPFDPMIVTVSLVRDESDWISKHVFRDKLSKL